MEKGVPSRDGGVARPLIETLGGAERQLWDAHERALRGAVPKVALVLHLSRLPAPRAHHVRVARVLMHDTAQRHAGQLFAMPNHDLVLMCARDTTERTSSPHSPAALADNLARLFAPDMPDREQLISEWDLADGGADRLSEYLRRRAYQSGGQPGWPEPAPVVNRQSIGLTALQQIVARAPLASLMRRQTGLSLSPDRGRTLAARLAPAFQRITLGLEDLRAPDLVACAVGDAYLSHHFAEWMDSRIIALCMDDLARGGRLFRPAIAQSLPVLIDLGVRSIVSAEFAALSRKAAVAGLQLWVGVKLLLAAANLDLLDHARSLLALTGCRLAIVFSDPLTVGIIDAGSLKADFAIMPWSAQLRQAWPSQDPRRRRFGPSSTNIASPRFILTGADCEQTIGWGQAAGIDLFAGAFPDQVQAATRMQHCHSAAGCSLAQCVGRAGSMGPVRSGCSNPALLDSVFEPSASPSGRPSARPSARLAARSAACG